MEGKFFFTSTVDGLVFRLPHNAAPFVLPFTSSSSFSMQMLHLQCTSASENHTINHKQLHVLHAPFTQIFSETYYPFCLKKFLVILSPDLLRLSKILFNQVLKSPTDMSPRHLHTSTGMSSELIACPLFILFQAFPTYSLLNFF